MLVTTFVFVGTILHWLTTEALANTLKEVAYQLILTSTPDENGSIFHEVQPGQAAWTIADYYEIDLADLLAQNNLTADSLIFPGDLLYIRLADTPTETLDASQPLAGQESAPNLVTPTATPPIDAKYLGPTPEILTPTDIPHATPSLIGGSTAPRSSLVPIFLVLGAGLLVLVFITVMTNYRRI